MRTWPAGMPEGDTIWRTAAALRPRLAGERVLRAASGGVKGAMGPRLETLVGAHLTEVDAVGKHLVMRFDNGLALRTHMRMKGSWHIYRPGEAWRKSARTATLTLEFPSWVAVGFSVPDVELTRSRDGFLSHLGPDILKPGFDVTVAVARARTLRPESLGEMLLDQRVCAGIGNVYKCEVLWRLRLDPWQPPDALPDDLLARVYTTARELMLPNLRGGSVRRFPDGPQPGGRRGRPAAMVHGRAGRPCPRCLGAVRVRAQGEQARLTYFCPTCQQGSEDSPAA